MLGTGARLPRSLRHGLLRAALLAPLGSATIAVARPEIGRDLGLDPVR